MGSPFHALLIELLERDGTFSGCKDKKIICPKVTKMGSLTAWPQNRPEIDYNRVVVLRCQRHIRIPSKS